MGGDIHTSLLFAAQLKRAAVLEQWLVQHMEHVPGTVVLPSDNTGVQRARCSCGASIELTIITTVVVRTSDE